MCSKKIFGGGSSRAAEVSTPAASVAAPTTSSNAESVIATGETNTEAKGKRKLTINRVGIGTGVNI